MDRLNLSGASPQVVDLRPIQGPRMALPGVRQWPDRQTDGRTNRHFTEHFVATVSKSLVLQTVLHRVVLTVYLSSSGLFLMKIY